MNRPLDSAAKCAVVSVLACLEKSHRSTCATLRDVPSGYETWTSVNGRSCLAFKRRNRCAPQTQTWRLRNPQALILGDEREWVATAKQAVGSATSIECDLDNNRLEALTAITGLPPLFWLETPHHIVVTSDLFLLKCVREIDLRFDVEGVMDFVEIGRPVGHRTLFHGVRLIPAGTRFMAAASGVTMQSAWQLPEPNPCASWDEYTALQAATFNRAIGGIGGHDTALSLTAGLDSRTILAALIARQSPVTALTVTGDRVSIDAQVAARLCKEYGIVHHTITLGAEFWSNLPELAEQASLLSGGLSSVGHSGQLHCYQVAGIQAQHKMLSGYLGNQIGRFGTEGLTPRCADAAFLTAEFVSRRTSTSVEGWYTSALRPDGLLNPQFLLQEESLFGGLCSYVIANSGAIQQTPYASRALIENLSRLPVEDANERADHRVRDLKHRFLGVPLERSFQRRFINEVGGFVADYPINWGWRSRGGVSIPGLFRGGLALTDAIVTSRLTVKPVVELIRVLGISGLHEIRPERQRTRAQLTEFVRDTLTASTTLSSGLFDRKWLEGRLECHRSGEHIGWDKTLLSAVDLALAAKNFDATA
jgi:hypothetical protein